MTDLRLQFRADGLADVVVPAEHIGRLLAKVRIADNAAAAEGGRLIEDDWTLIRGLRDAVEANHGVSASGHVSGQDAPGRGPWVTTSEYAEMQHVSERTVRRWAVDGSLPSARRTPAGWIIPASAPRPAQGA